MNYKGIQWNHLPQILERSVSSAHLAEHLHGKILFRGDQNQNINLNDSRCQWTGMRAGRDGLPCLCTVVRTMNNRLRRDGSVDETSEIPFRWWKVVRNDSKAGKERLGYFAWIECALDLFLPQVVFL